MSWGYWGIVIGLVVMVAHVRLPGVGLFQVQDIARVLAAAQGWTWCDVPRDRHRQSPSRIRG